MSSSIRPSSLAELRATLQHAMSTPSQAAAMADLIPEMIRGLPPARADLASRPEFALGTDVVFQCIFEDVETSSGQSEDSPQTIELPYDVWIRGAAAYATLQLPGQGDQLPDADALAQLAGIAQRLSITYGSCGRFLFETNWRVDSRQGFIQRGAAGEVLVTANLITGTGKYPAALDWRLQYDQTIDVRVRNVLTDLTLPADAGGAERPPIKLLVVAFYGLKLPLRAGVPRGR